MKFPPPPKSYATIFFHDQHHNISNIISISIINRQSYISKVLGRYLHSPGSHQSTQFLESVTQSLTLSLLERLVTLKRIVFQYPRHFTHLLERWLGIHSLNFRVWKWAAHQLATHYHSRLPHFPYFAKKGRRGSKIHCGGGTPSSFNWIQVIYQCHCANARLARVKLEGKHD